MLSRRTRIWIASIGGLAVIALGYEALSWRVFQQRRAEAQVRLGRVAANLPELLPGYGFTRGSPTVTDCPPDSSVGNYRCAGLGLEIPLSVAGSPGTAQRKASLRAAFAALADAGITVGPSVEESAATCGTGFICPSAPFDRDGHTYFIWMNGQSSGALWFGLFEKR